MSDVIDRLEQHICDECNVIDREAAFDDYLDCEGDVEVRGLSFQPSRIWKEMDPVAYRCGVNDYADGERWVEVRGDYYDWRAAQDALDVFLSDLESRVADLEQEIEDAEEQINAATDHQERSDLEYSEHKLRDQLAEAIADVAAVNKYQFS